MTPNHALQRLPVAAELRYQAKRRSNMQKLRVKCWPIKINPIFLSGYAGILNPQF